MHHRTHRRRAALVAALLTGGLTLPAAGADASATVRPASGAPAHAAAATDTWRARPAQYPRTVTVTDIPIRMDDGTVLRGDLVRPARADGSPVPGRFPVIVTITAYNKAAIGPGGGLAGPPADYLVRRGYHQLTVDARGTGSSEGRWAAFSDRENKDAGRIIEWAADRPWSNGKVGMRGPSYMGISQLFAAGHRPKGLKAIFPLVAAADVYRDVVAAGGQIDVGFMPFWLGLVTSAGLVPPAYGAADPSSAIQTMLDHILGGATFTAPLTAQALLGGYPAYDGPFYRERSPIEVIDRIRVPTFLIGGEFDLFQRGTPLLFERLHRNGVPTKLIFGPWDHLQGSSGAGVEKAGYGGLAELQLRWFDHYLKGVDGHLDRIAPFSYYEQGSGRWVRKRSWMAADLQARQYLLSGSSSIGGQAGALRVRGPVAGTSTLPAIPATGLCTRSMNQWTAGVPRQVLAGLPCFEDNALNDLGGLTFETPPQATPLRFQGPMNLRLFVSSPTGDGALSIAVEDVAPDGRVSRLTGGWQVVSHRALDLGRSRFLDGRLIQPYHPHTEASKRALAAGEVAPVDVEIFPTGAVVAPGHRLRVAIQVFDVPHLFSPLPDLPGQLAPMTIHTGPRHPSALTLPVR